MPLRKIPWVRVLVEGAVIVGSILLGSIQLLMSKFAGIPRVDPSLLGTVTLRREPHLMNLLAARESGERSVRDSLAEMVDQAARIAAALEDST